MKTETDQFKRAYKEEAEEWLADLEAALLELEEAPDKSGLIGRIFRAVHTIKGSGAMFGFEEIAAFTHEVEAVLDLVRSGEIPVSRELISLTLLACDQIRQMAESDETDSEETGAIVTAFRAMMPAAHPAALPEDSSDAALRTYRIRFRPASDIFANGTNPILLLDELRELGECRVTPHIHKVPPLKELAPEACYFHWHVILTTDRGLNTIKDVFIFVEDNSQLTVDLISEADELDDAPEDYKKIGEILIERGDITDDTLRDVLRVQKRTGELLVESKAVDPDAVSSALAEQQHMRNLRKRRREVSSVSSIRVAADKLDTLVDLVGELVTVQASLTQRALCLDDAELLTVTESVERLSAALRDTTMEIRMLPVSTAFTRFRRLVHDLSRELEKEVRMVTEGGDTELDKTVIERLNDPLIHIIRNCLSHGIETAAVRTASGKPPQGTLRLSARHSGSQVVIVISDDGAGLDRGCIQRRALEMGLMSPGQTLSEEALFSVISAPGFSTVSEADRVSGRGVGMDVVRRSIENLRGTIDISSQSGQGTVFTLRLPLTLAIIEGLLVTVGENIYVIPLSSVEECMNYDEVVIGAGGAIRLRGEMLPCISLRQIFEEPGDVPAEERVVLLQLGNFRVGLVVDAIIGDYQTVIKGLGRVYKNVKAFSGSTILADGSVALILDPHRLVEMVRSSEQRRKAQP